MYVLDERGLRVPVSRNFSVGVEQMLPGGFHGRFEFLRKRGRDGFTFVNAVLPDVPPTQEMLAAYNAQSVEGYYRLRNVRRDAYDSFEAAVRKTFRRQSEVLASYTRSRAISNAVMDVNIDDPILVEDNEGRMPWDAPNRLLSWGILALSEKNTIAYLVEWRDGFPFHIIDDEGRLRGRNIDRRYPAYFNLNLHWERKFTLGRWRWAWRGGFNNVTNRLNPTVVNNNASSSRFLQYAGGQHRAFVMRIRWLGRREAIR